MPDAVTRDLTPVVATFAGVLAGEGPHAALGLLNARVRHRFTGIFRLELPEIYNVELFDRENPDILIAGPTPQRETYCGIVGVTDAAFATEDSTADPRLRGHAAQAAVISYHGVPLRIGGNCVGTLCHFDSRPRVLPAPEMLLLEEAARVLASDARVRARFEVPLR